MEERKFIRLKKEEYGIKEYIKRSLGKGKISRLDIEYTPIGEKIIISTSRPGIIIGRRGEKIDELTNVLKTRFKLENPHIEIKEIENPLFDSQLVAEPVKCHEVAYEMDCHTERSDQSRSCSNQRNPYRYRRDQNADGWC